MAPQGAKGDRYEAIADERLVYFVARIVPHPNQFKPHHSRRIAL